MADYISLEAAIKTLDEWAAKADDGLIDDAEWKAFRIVEDALKDIPAADVRPVVRGVWVSVHDRYGICSNCHRGDHIDPLAGFCRFCGAELQTGENNAK